MIRPFALSACVAVLTLTGCTQDAVNEPMLPMGDFSLGHNIVIAENARKVTVSRAVTEQEWTTAMTQALATRFGRYQGDELYHFGVSVEGFMVAPPGVPLVYTPKSALIIEVAVWDDAAGRKLNDEPQQFTIFEDTDSQSVLVGSGLSRDKQEQIDGLAENAAQVIERWMSEQHIKHGWFTDSPTFNPEPEPEEPKER